MASRVTLKDIADRLGISQNTASLALRDRDGVSDATRAAVKQAAREMNYTYKKKKQPKNICVVSTIKSSNDNYYFSHFQSELENRLHTMGFNIITISSIEKYSLNELSDFCEVNDISGIITVANIGVQAERDIITLGIPIVFAGYYPYDIKIDSVLEDNAAGMMCAVNELLRRGYRRFGFVGSTYTDQGFFERYMAFRGGLEINRLSPVEGAVIIDHSIDDLCNVSSMCNILRNIEDMPEVFMCANDKIAMSVMKALSSMGLCCPEDVGVVGFDNCDLARLTTPSLATIDNFSFLQVDVAIDRLRFRMHNADAPPYKILIPAVFMDGGSILQKL